MTKQEKSRIDREMRDRAMKAWHMAQKVSGVISIPYEIAALDGGCKVIGNTIDNPELLKPCK